MISKKGIVDKNIIFLENDFTNAENPSPKFGCSRPGLFFGQMFFQSVESECFLSFIVTKFWKKNIFLKSQILS